MTPSLRLPLRARVCLTARTPVLMVPLTPEDDLVGDPVGLALWMAGNELAGCTFSAWPDVVSTALPDDVASAMGAPESPMMPAARLAQYDMTVSQAKGLLQTLEELRVEAQRWVQALGYVAQRGSLPGLAVREAASGGGPLITLVGRDGQQGVAVTPKGEIFLVVQYMGKLLADPLWAGVTPRWSGEGLRALIDRPAAVLARLQSERWAAETAADLRRQQMQEIVREARNADRGITVSSTLGVAGRAQRALPEGVRGEAPWQDLCVTEAIAEVFLARDLASLAEELSLCARLWEAGLLRSHRSMPVTTTGQGASEGMPAAQRAIPLDLPAGLDADLAILRHDGERPAATPWLLVPAPGVPQEAQPTIWIQRAAEQPGGMPVLEPYRPETHRGQCHPTTMRAWLERVVDYAQREARERHRCDPADLQRDLERATRGSRPTRQP